MNHVPKANFYSRPHGLTASRPHGLTASRPHGLTASRLFLAVFLTLLCGKIGFSQATLFEVFPSPGTSLSATEKAIYDQYAAFPITESIQLVRMGNLRTSQSNGDLSFHLPGETQSYQFRVKGAEFTDDDNYVWNGSRMEDDTMEFPDYILLVNDSSNLVGEIVIDKKMYKLFPVSSQFQAFVKTITPTHGGCGTTETTPPESSPPCIMGTDQCFTDVLIMFTPDVAVTYPNMGAIGKLAYEQLNASFKRSNMKQRTRLVGVEKWEGAWVNATVPDELTAFHTKLNTLGTYSNQLRAERHADLVILLTSGILHTDVIGQAFEIPALIASDGCAVVGITNALNATYTFTHEVGHLFGGRHENDSDDLPARAHEFDATYKGVLYHYLTIMHRDVNQLLNFSNPNKNYLGVPTGTADRNNACKMQSYGCSVSGLLPSTSCRIRATPGIICSSPTVTMSLAFKTDGGFGCTVGHYAYDYSFDGVNYTNGLVTFLPFFSLNYPPGTKLVFFRIRAYDGIGNVLANTFEWVDILELRKSCVFDLVIPNTGSGLAQLNEMQVFPNPANDLIEVQLNTSEAHLVDFEIFDIQGKSVLRIANQAVQKGLNYCSINIEQLNKGYFVVVGKGSKFSSHQNFIKQ